MEKLARLAAEAGIKQMAPEIYKFSWLLNEDKNKMWDEWVKKRLEEKRKWVGLTDDERTEIWKNCDPTHAGYVTALVEAKLKEKNT